eukprot:4716007-Prymnesium_polylepis.1
MIAPAWGAARSACAHSPRGTRLCVHTSHGTAVRYLHTSSMRTIILPSLTFLSLRPLLHSHYRTAGRRDVPSGQAGTYPLDVRVRVHHARVRDSESEPVPTCHAIRR